MNNSQYTRAKSDLDSQKEQLQSLTEEAISGYTLFDGNIDMTTIRQRTNDYVSKIFSAKDIRELPSNLHEQVLQISKNIGTENVQDVVSHLLSGDVADNIHLYENPVKDISDISQLSDLYNKKIEIEKSSQQLDSELSHQISAEGHVSKKLVDAIDYAQKTTKGQGEQPLPPKEALLEVLSDTLDSAYTEKPSLLERAKRAFGKGSEPKTMSRTVMDMYHAESLDELPISDAYKEIISDEIGTSDPKAITKHILSDPNKMKLIQGFSGGSPNNNTGVTRMASSVLDCIEKIETIENVRPIEEALLEGPQQEPKSFENELSRDEQELSNDKGKDDDLIER